VGGSEVTQSATRKTPPTFYPGKFHGKMLSKAVEALLPWTLVATRLRTLLRLKSPPPSPSTLPFALLPFTLQPYRFTMLLEA
jgi:hypothetical protein